MVKIKGYWLWVIGLLAFASTFSAQDEDRIVGDRHDDDGERYEVGRDQRRRYGELHIDGLGSNAVFRGRRDACFRYRQRAECRCFGDGVRDQRYVVRYIRESAASCATVGQRFVRNGTKW